MPAEYNPVLSVINYVAKNSLIFKYFLHKEIHFKIFLSQDW